MKELFKLYDYDRLDIDTFDFSRTPIPNRNLREQVVREIEFKNALKKCPVVGEESRFDEKRGALSYDESADDQPE